MPDLALPSAISAEEVGESSRDGSLPWNRIRPADFRREGAYASLLPELQREHDARVAHDPNFQFAIEEIAAIETMRSEKSVSLNLAKRKAEREARTQEQLARENARRAALGEPALKSATEIKDRAGRHPRRGGPDHGRPVPARTAVHGAGEPNDVRLRRDSRVAELVGAKRAATFWPLRTLKPSPALLAFS